MPFRKMSFNGAAGPGVHCIDPVVQAQQKKPDLTSGHALSIQTPHGLLADVAVGMATREPESQRRVSAKVQRLYVIRLDGFPRTLVTDLLVQIWETSGG